MSMDAKRKLGKALVLTRALFPHTAAILARMDVRLDERVETACVCPSGRMLFSPAFLDRLTLHRTVFVVAHELYHVLYGVFDRLGPDLSPERRRLVNIAHDFIINDMLAKKFRTETQTVCCLNLSSSYVDEEDAVCEESYIPKEGLFWEDFREDYERLTGRPQPSLDAYSLESLALDLEKCQKMLPGTDMLQRMMDAAARARQDWPTETLGGSPLGTLNAADFPGADEEEDVEVRLPSDRTWRLGELLSSEEERGLFPEEAQAERASRAVSLQGAKQACEELGIVDEVCCAGRGCEPGAGDVLVRALDGRYETPWEEVLQKWFDDTLPPVRSWGRASRRTGDRTDIVLPGRKKEGSIIYIVLDTSGSMGDVLSTVLGMIQSFGRTADVRCAHILECDTVVTSEEDVDIDSLTEYQIRGLGGSDMSAAMLRLAEDPSVASVLVLTDGFIKFPPPEEIPYDVLWAISIPSEWGEAPRWFSPPYGRVVGMPARPTPSFKL